MKQETLRRLEKLEIRHGGEELGPLAIFIAIVDSQGQRVETLGWKEGMTRDPQSFMRLDGESDEECGERAARAVRAQPGRDPLSVPCLVAITEE